MTEFTKFAVGEAWPGAMLPQEGLYFDYTAEGGAAFVLFFNTPTEKEAKGVREGRIELAITVRPPIMFMCCKIQGVGGWMDAPYSIRRHPAETSSPRGVEDSEGLPIQIFLVDLQNRKISAIRFISTDSKFANAFRKNVFKQLNTSFSDAAYDSMIYETYQSLSSKELAQRADVTFRTR